MLGFGFGISAVAARSKGAPYRITINGVLFERATLDGAFVEIDGLPVYMEV